MITSYFFLSLSFSVLWIVTLCCLCSQYLINYRGILIGTPGKTACLPATLQTVIQILTRQFCKLLYFRLVLQGLFQENNNIMSFKNVYKLFESALQVNILDCLRCNLRIIIILFFPIAKFPFLHHRESLYWKWLWLKYYSHFFIKKSYSCSGFPFATAKLDAVE